MDALQQIKYDTVLIGYVITFSYSIQCIKQLMLKNRHDIQQTGIKYKQINATAVVDIYILTNL